ncbi:hypothetical protein XELAEV_18026531mg [Xenopus laevis]|uniref:Uncharacterized protein n=1 Tax=Xenopus laevis TaxID=8355 RepID=A0A974CVW1_XENLA|nr:hypothetical protein XELAEV_18026531mg [Xenopus laevis]
MYKKQRERGRRITSRGYKMVRRGTTNTHTHTGWGGQSGEWCLMGPVEGTVKKEPPGLWGREVRGKAQDQGGWFMKLLREEVTKALMVQDRY